MNAAYARLDRMAVFDRVIEGLGDDYDIKTICNLMLSKLVEIDADETSRRLDSAGQKFQATLSTKLKDNAVKQEVEKLQEAVKDVLRTTVRLQNMSPAASGGAMAVQAPLWRNYMDLVKKEYNPQLKTAEEEVKSQT
jgi:cullin-associated NEDD8-dissociated protein 1